MRRRGKRQKNTPKTKEIRQDLILARRKTDDYQPRVETDSPMMSSRFHRLVVFCLAKEILSSLTKRYRPKAGKEKDGECTKGKGKVNHWPSIDSDLSFSGTLFLFLSCLLVREKSMGKWEKKKNREIYLGEFLSYIILAHISRFSSFLWALSRKDEFFIPGLLSQKPLFFYGKIRGAPING